jgi:hypothetical protein
LRRATFLVPGSTLLFVERSARVRAIEPSGAQSCDDCTPRESVGAPRRKNGPIRVQTRDRRRVGNSLFG